MTEEKIYKIIDQATYKAYLKDLFITANTINGTVNKSLEETLLDKAMTYGRTHDEAIEDIKYILNVHSAAMIVLDCFAEEQFGTDGV